jgi:hypothetical protein
MRVSIWQQDRKGARWLRLGVVIMSMADALPFRKAIAHGDSPLSPTWPRLCWYTMERDVWDLWDHERREDNAKRTNGNS